MVVAVVARMAEILAVAADEVPREMAIHLKPAREPMDPPTTPCRHLAEMAAAVPEGNGLPAPRRPSVNLDPVEM